MSESVINIERVRTWKQGRFSPIRGLTPEVLSRQMDNFATGYLREFALTMDAIERRDDVLQCVAPKRKGAVARSGYEIVTVDESREAKKHKEALEYFYNNLRVVNSIDLHEVGGTKLLVRQMMDCVGKRYSVHEILWRIDPGSGKLTAELRWVPLWFFENITGKLRFLQSDYTTYGVDLDPEGWMVSVGQGIMEACAVAYMFKHLPLKDWLIYCEKHGMPGIQGKTDAAKGSEEWDAMADAVAAMAADCSCVTNRGDEISKIDLGTTGQLPYPAMVERMDRAMAALWRGADLSTMSKGQDAVGASVQGGETAILEQDDAEMIADTLNMQLEPLVIKYLFGEGVKPMAYFRLISESQGETMEFKRKVWMQFQNDGTVNDILANQVNLKRLTTDVGLPVNEEYVDPYLPVQTASGAMVSGDKVLDSEGDIIGATVGENGEDGLKGQGGLGEVVNEVLADGSLQTANSGGKDGSAGASPYQSEVLKAFAADLQPLRKRIERIMQIEDPELLKEKIQALVGEINSGKIYKDIAADPESERALAEMLKVELKGTSREKA